MSGWRDELVEAERLLTIERSRGVTLTAGNQRIVVEADEGVLDERGWAELARLKSALLVCLYREQEEHAACCRCGARPANHRDNGLRRYCRDCERARPESPHPGASRPAPSPGHGAAPPLWSSERGNDVPVAQA